MFKTAKQTCSKKHHVSARVRTGIQVLVFTLEVYDLTSSAEESAEKLSCKETNCWLIETDINWELSAFSFFFRRMLASTKQVLL